MWWQKPCLFVHCSAPRDSEMCARPGNNLQPFNGPGFVLISPSLSKIASRKKLIPLDIFIEDHMSLAPLNHFAVWTKLYTFVKFRFLFACSSLTWGPLVCCDLTWSVSYMLLHFKSGIVRSKAGWPRGQPDVQLWLSFWKKRTHSASPMTPKWVHGRNGVNLEVQDK